MARTSLCHRHVVLGLTLAALSTCTTEPLPCSPAVCLSGCCDAQSECQKPTELHCGTRAMRCVACTSGDICSAGQCVAPIPPNDGGSGGGSATTDTGVETFDAGPSEFDAGAHEGDDHSCLTLTPSPVDFGTFPVDCASAARAINLYNTCSSAIEIQEFSLLDSAGMHCGDGGACPFSIRSAPTIPPNGLTLGFGELLTLSLGYQPSAPGLHTGALSIRVREGNHERTHLSALSGKAEPSEIQIGCGSFG